MNLYNIIPKSEKNKAIAAVSLIVIALATAFFYEGTLLHNRTIEQAITKEEDSIDLAIKGIEIYYLAPYKQRLLNLIATHKEIPQALLEHDRDTLYSLTLPLYKALKRENRYLQVMHFHLPDGSSFLRMQNPKQSDADLTVTRPALQYVHRERKSLTCYEIGIDGPYYRIIQPVFYKGSFAGVLELGIRTHSVLESLQKHISNPLTTFFIDDKWRKVTKPLEHKFLKFKKYALNTHNDALYKQLPSDLDLSQDNQRVTLGEKSYLLHAYPIFNDFKGEPIGGFVVLQDISSALNAKRTFIFQSLTFSCFLMIIALLVLYFTFGKLIDKLEMSQSKLEKTILKLGIEIKERKKTALKLYKSKKEWERTFDATGDVVTIMNSELQIIKANQTAYKMLNAKPGTLEGKFCYDVFSNRSSPCDGCPALATTINREINYAEIEHQNLEKSFLITTAPVPDENGKFSHVVHIAKDITELKELETQLRQAQKMEAIGTLAGGIAHDFNNILTAIYGYTQLAMMKAGDNEKITRDLTQVTNATGRATDLVKQILTFSRKTEQKKRPIQISPIVKEALKLLRSSIPTKIEIKQNITCQRNILADPTQIHQIIMNLTTNAYHSMMETGGIIGVSLEDVTIAEKGVISELEIKPGKYVRLEVSDTGCGMDEDLKEKIFDPYFTTKETGKGTGLGLAVVHGIVTSHLGLVHVYSEVGQGTTFHVYLPIIEQKAEHYSTQAKEEPVRGGNERIMFVDDAENIVQLADEVLTLHGYKATLFTNSVQAMQDFEKHPDQYDLVITDMSMPNMTGLELSERIKEIRPDLPIILCSGYSEMIVKDNALNMGVNEYIQKPLNMDTLGRVMRKLLDTSSLTRH
jgi:signal transduction histidine kinase/CheY-like chemotaxis protein